MNRKRKDILEVLLKVSKKVSASLELDKVTNIILKEARLFLKTDYSALFLLDEKTKRLFLIGAKGFKEDQIENLKVLGSWERINSEIVKKSRALAVNNVIKSAAFPLGAFLAVPLKTDFEKIIGVLIVSDHKRRKRRFTDEDKKMLYTLANHVAIALLNAKLYKDLKDLFLDTIASLVAAIDAKDPYTHGHSERVAQYAKAIAKAMGKKELSFLENLKLSSLLHDAGKIGISDTILLKKTALNNKELEKIHEHPLIGAKIAGSVIKSRGIIDGIAQHHEYFNGRGYPKHLRGKRISLEARIIAIADAFDTLTTDRPYQKALTSKEAFVQIEKSAGTHFDPRIVKVFKKSCSKYPDLWQIK